MGWIRRALAVATLCLISADSVPLGPEKGIGPSGFGLLLEARDKWDESRSEEDAGEFIKLAMEEILASGGLAEYAMSGAHQVGESGLDMHLLPDYLSRPRSRIAEDLDGMFFDADEPIGHDE